MNTHPVDLDSLEAQTLAWRKYLKDVGEIIMELRLREQSQIPVVPHGAQRYINELEKRLRMACEPCADCGHIDYRELDDVLDREGVTRYSAPPPRHVGACKFGCGWDDDPHYVRPGYSVVAGCPVHDLAPGGAVTPADVPTGRSEGADTPEAGAKESSGSEREQEREPLDARVQRHDALLRIRELEAINAQVVRNRDALREREQELTNALPRMIALTLAYAGSPANSSLGDAIPQTVWDALHEEGLLETVRDIADEADTRTTDEGFAALVAALAPAVEQEPCRRRGAHGYWCCAPKGHSGDHIWNDMNGIPGTVGYRLAPAVEEQR